VPESRTSVWEAEDTVVEELLTFDTGDSLFWLEETGRTLALLSHVFGVSTSGFCIKVSYGAAG
jgi:hypothetical protein